MMASELLARSRALLLDFDGPVCSVFAGIPASTVADQLRDILADGGRTELPKAVATSTDPFTVLRYAATLGEAEARYVEAAFTAHETEAIVSAKPTTGAAELIEKWHASGRPLAIVSNNSTTAIKAYLQLYDLLALVNAICARESPNVALLKPNPHLLQNAMDYIDKPATDCVFVGDSVSDIDAARAAGVRFIGYANKPGKLSCLGAADWVVETLDTLSGTLNIRNQ